MSTIISNEIKRVKDELSFLKFMFYINVNSKECVDQFNEKVKILDLSDRLDFLHKLKNFELFGEIL
jgi:hypothetical protein